jgi:nucleoside-diphosphate-sugar epimerase
MIRLMVQRRSCRAACFASPDIEVEDEILVTGAAGFIGFHVSERLLQAGHQVTGIDNLNDYYEVSLKEARLNLLANENFRFVKLDLADREGMAQLFAEESSTALSILPLRRAYVIHWKTHMFTPKLT